MNDEALGRPQTRSWIEYALKFPSGRIEVMALDPNAVFEMATASDPPISAAQASELLAREEAGAFPTAELVVRIVVTTRTTGSWERVGS